MTYEPPEDPPAPPHRKIEAIFYAEHVGWSADLGVASGARDSDGPSVVSNPSYATTRGVSMAHPGAGGDFPLELWITLWIRRLSGREMRYRSGFNQNAVILG